MLLIKTWTIAFFWFRFYAWYKNSANKCHLKSIWCVHSHIISQPRSQALVSGFFPYVPLYNTYKGIYYIGNLFSETSACGVGLVNKAIVTCSLELYVICGMKCECSFHLVVSLYVSLGWCLIKSRTSTYTTNLHGHSFTCKSMYNFELKH